MKSRCILFLGTPRSGTSCGAGVLHRLGLPMGERFLPPDDWNPEGYYQDAEFESVIIRALANLAGDVESSQDIDWFPEWPLPPDSVSEEREAIRAMAEKRSAAHAVWGVKSNRLIYFLDELQAAADVTVITTTRARDNSVASWRQRSGDSAKRAGEVIDRMNAGITEALKKADIVPVLTIPYDALISAPAEWVGKIAEVAGLPVKQEAVEWINPQLRRFV